MKKIENTNLTLEQFENLLKRELKPIKVSLDDHTGALSSIRGTVDDHTKTLRSIKRTVEAHTESLSDIENRIKPLAETTGTVVIDHSRRIGYVELRVDDLEPRVDALEVVVSK